MAVIPTNKIAVNNTTRTANTPQGVIVCGNCGCVIAAEHVDRHITWENSAKAATVVTATLPTGWN
jgi:transcription initiation factor TFIIIB Brf1 subunit/transcription initiation factor TFIIB